MSLIPGSTTARPNIWPRMERSVSSSGLIIQWLGGVNDIGWRWTMAWTECFLANMPALCNIIVTSTCHTHRYRRMNAHAYVFTLHMCTMHCHDMFAYMHGISTWVMDKDIFSHWWTIEWNNGPVIKIIRVYLKHCDSKCMRLNCCDDRLRHAYLSRCPCVPFLPPTAQGQEGLHNCQKTGCKCFFP